MATTVEAISPGDVTKIGIGVIVGLIVIGALSSMVITHIVGRIIVLAVVVAACVVVWVQRTHIKDDVNSHACQLNATFFGVHVDVPDHVKTACRNDS